jgi:TonB family protein
MPRYPPSLAETGLTGTVVVSFVVGAQGRPEEVRIESSSHPMFTAEVKAVLPLWRFEPARDATGAWCASGCACRSGSCWRTERLGLPQPVSQAVRSNTRSHTPWPSLMPRFSNLVSGRYAGLGA